MNINKNAFIKRRIVIVSIALIIGAIHIIGPGRFFSTDLHKLFSSYFSDITLPFVFYFLLCASEFKIPLMKRWESKLAVSIILPSVAETMQFIGIPFLGSTFDPLDYFMYGIGSGAACIIERMLFPRVFNFWEKERNI